MSAIQVEGYRLSPQQKRIWLLQQAGGSQAYRSVCVLYIEGELDQAKLQAAWQEVVARNEILRTVYPSLPGMNVPVQSVAESEADPITNVDLTNLDAAQQQTQLAALFDDARRFPFDYTDGPLLLATLIRLAPQNHALLLNVSALCADYASLETLERQLLSSLNENAIAEPAQYADMSEFFNELMESEDTEGGRAYWRQQSFPDPLQLGTRSTDTTEFAPEMFTFAIDPSTWDRIADHANTYGVSTRVFLLTCWQALLWRLTGQDEFTIGVSTSGRTYEEIEDALGLFARQLPLSAHLHGSLRFNEALVQAEQASQEVERWQDYFAWPHDDGQPQFFPIAFDFANHPSFPEYGGLSITHGQQYVCIDRFDVSLSAIRQGEQLTTALYYNAAIYEREDIERLAERFTKLLESVAHDPETEISRLEILGERERRQLLFEFNETDRDFGHDKCLPELFEDQVDRTPDAVAVISDDGELTYAVLDSCANQLARRLRDSGVGRETRVAVCAERSVEMLVGLLGTLKAGGAYIPLDPSYPVDRLA